MVLTRTGGTVVARSLGDELVLLNLASGACCTAHPSATLLRRLYEQGASVDDCAQALCRAYGLEPGQARAEVLGFLGSAREAGLLDAG